MMKLNMDKKVLFYIMILTIWANLLLLSLLLYKKDCSMNMVVKPHLFEKLANIFNCIKGGNDKVTLSSIVSGNVNATEP